MTRSPEHPSIVVIDDEPANVVLLERTLRKAGQTGVRTFTDPVAGLALIQASPPDLVLLDLHMPDLDGLAVLEALRPLRGPEAFLPVVILTGDVDRATRRRCLDAGADDFVTKPFDPDEVVLRCANLLRTRQLYLALAARNVSLQGEVLDRTATLRTELDLRSRTAGSLARLTTEGTVEATAERICNEIVATIDTRSAALIEFRVGDLAVPIGAAGDAAGQLVIGRPLPPAVAASLRDRANGGLWTDERPLDLLGRRDRKADRTRVFAPLQIEGLLSGLLAVDLPGRTPVDRLSGRLSDVLEYAAVSGAILAPLIGTSRDRERLRGQIREVIATSAFHPVFQPIVDLETGLVVGYEALSRFADGVPPDRRFADAGAVGLGPDLELACLEAAVSASGRLGEGFLSLNVSPTVVTDRRRLEPLVRLAGRPVVLEITEHAPITDYAPLRPAIDAIQPPVRLAIDDAGAGYSSFRHIVELRPDFVKLDIALIRSVERDPARQALIAGIDYFALRVGCALIAEGIETEEERAALQALSVEFGQGYLLGRPAVAG